MGLWKTHFFIATKASGLSLTEPNWLSQHDQSTTLHSLMIRRPVNSRGQFGQESDGFREPSSRTL